MREAEGAGTDLVVCDTSGRLHTNVGLMEELAKCRRSLAKKLPGAPHETLLVLDGTTGACGPRTRGLHNPSLTHTRACSCSGKTCERSRQHHSCVQCTPGGCNLIVIVSTGRLSTEGGR